MAKEHMITIRKEEKRLVLWWRSSISSCASALLCVQMLNFVLWWSIYMLEETNAIWFRIWKENPKFQPSPDQYERSWICLRALVKPSDHFLQNCFTYERSWIYLRALVKLSGLHCSYSSISSQLVSSCNLLQKITKMLLNSANSLKHPVNASQYNNRWFLAYNQSNLIITLLKH